jgi:signal transduction histidine kinase
LKQNILLSALLFLFICVPARAQDNQAEAIDSIKQVLPFQDGDDRVLSYTELAWYYRNFNVDSALIFSRLALKYAEDYGADSTLASAFNSLANSFESVGDLDSAEYYFKQSLQKRVMLGDSLRVARTLNNLGILYDERGLFSLSLENYFRSLRLFEDYSEDPFDRAMVLGNIGIVYKKQRAYEQVLEYYERALNLYEELGSQFGQVVTQGNIGSVLINLQRYTESIDYATKALKGYEELGYLRYVPYMEHNIAVARDSLGELSLAEEWYNKSIAGHREHQNSYELANSLSAFANNSLKQSKADQARTLALEAVSAAKEARSLEFEVNALKILAEANARTGRFADAFENYKAHSAGKDSLFEADKTRQIFELTTEYETEKKEQQIEVQQTKLARNQIFIVALISVAVLLIVLVLVIRNRARKKRQLIQKEAQLQLREAEITAVINSQEKERNRFARDLHDGFGQLISVLKLNISRLGETDKKDTETRVDVFHQSETVIADMYTELRNICFDLMPQTLLKSGLEAALKEFGQRVSSSGHKVMEVQVFDLEERLPEVMGVSLFRISQEWINNVLKYSDADHISLQLTRDQAELTLTIEDNGKGFDPEIFYQGKGNGWRNISSRLNLIHGDFDIDASANSRGVFVSVNVPLTKLNDIPASTDRGMRETRDSLPTP